MRYEHPPVFLRCIARATGLLLLSCLTLLFCAQLAFAASVPQAGSAAAREMDRQLAGRLGQSAPARGVSLCITTPTDINNLDASSTLARQLQEEIARWFVQAGYDVMEIRKGRDILFEPATGEMLLTRKENLLGSRSVTSTALITGTYTIAPDHIRFNIRMVRTKNREILAMSTITIPMSKSVASLSRSSGKKGGGSGGGSRDGVYGIPIEPTVATLLP